jgi:hypothetical protein
MLWTLIPVQIAWASLLVTIISGYTSCDGPVCALATLNSHVAVLLGCAATSVVSLAVLIPCTHGLSRCNGWEAHLAAGASFAGAVALLGVAALLAGALIGLIIIAAFIFGLIATS